jgi:hypothetical protein
MLLKKPLYSHAGARARLTGQKRFLGNARQRDPLLAHQGMMNRGHHHQRIFQKRLCHHVQIFWRHPHHVEIVHVVAHPLQNLLAVEHLKSYVNAGILLTKWPQQTGNKVFGSGDHSNAQPSLL